MKQEKSKTKTKSKSKIKRRSFMKKAAVGTAGVAAATVAFPAIAQKRVEIVVVVEQIERAGFRIEARSDLLANPEDDHSLNVFADAIYRHTDRVLIRAVRK